MKKFICVMLIFCICILSLSCKSSVPVQELTEHADDSASDSAYRRTVLYYATEDGMMVPVMKKIPWEEGIGKAALSYLVSNYDNDLSASKLGVATVIPQGTEVDLKIEDTNAVVTLINLPEQSKDAQKNMITAIVNTLTEFASIKTVTIIADGNTLLKETSKLMLNVEDSDVSVSSGSAHHMTLYFPNQQASLNVPITRYCESEPTFEKAVEELVNGPENENLLNCFPEGTKLNSAKISENTAVVDLSSEFAQVSDTDGLMSACYECLYLTASEYAVIYDVEVRIDGNTCDLSSVSVFAPMYANEF
ncbi:MAG: GerMN domain-containing protein [Clostridia bacterium]|nr:GerMN domain-containing protein [Clostridia bacterium]